MPVKTEDKSSLERIYRRMSRMFGLIREGSSNIDQLISNAQSNFKKAGRSRGTEEYLAALDR